MPFDTAEEFTFGSVPIQTWDAIPTDTNTMASLRIQIESLTTNLWMPQLQGKRLSLVFTNSRAQLWIEDTLLMAETGTVSGTVATVVTRIDHPHHRKIYAGGGYTIQDTNRNDQVATNTFLRTMTNAVPRYALIYSFKASPEYLRQRERKLSEYYRLGRPADSREVICETLNVMGLTWLLQTELSDQLLAQQHDGVSLYHHRFGRMGQQEGYFIDVGIQQSGSYHKAGDSNIASLTFQSQVYFASAMEHGVIEQRQGGTNAAVSTVRILQMANQSGQRIYKATAANWSSISSQFVNYSAGDLAVFQAATASGSTLLLPANGSQTLNQWNGYGYVRLDTSGTIGMLISGGYSGGYLGNYRQIQPDIEYQLFPSQPDFMNRTPVGSPATLAADPVNLADGSFTHTHSDLSVGQAEPRGFAFERQYSSSRRDYNQAGLGYGWTHNYKFDLTETADVRARLGLATLSEMAAYLVATYVAYDVYAQGSSPKEWVVAALIANWALDQLKRNTISVTLGTQTIQFTRQPDGSFTAPAGVTMTLAKTNSVFEVRQRHGNIFRFNTTNRLAEIEDLYGKKMTFTHLADGRLQQAKDAYNRTLTFNYGTSNRLDSVTDSTGRSVQFGYDGSLNLTSIIDPEGKTSTLGCDTNHHITQVEDADDRIVVQNFYDEHGRVIEQWTEGNSNKVWRLYYSDYCNIEENSFGNLKSFYYDHRARNIGVADAYGYRTRLVYDGQDHVTQSISPLYETNTFAYDGFHNLLVARDPLGLGVTNFYDGLHRKTNAVDARGFTNRFLYDAKHRLTETRNPLGNRVTNVYNATDGTLTSTTDAATNTTSFLYDAYGLMQRTTHPGGDYETFDRDARGDVLIHRNPRGFFTTNVYNLRRQLTNSATLSNSVTRLAYDNSGNLLATTDARGFTATNLWSATGKLLVQAQPATAAGLAIVRNEYDSRDWLNATVDPLGRTNRQTYYPNGWLQSRIDPLQRAHIFDYYGNGLKALEYDSLNRTWNYTYNARGEQIAARPPGEASPRRFTYDANGNRIGLTNLLGHCTAFQYDAANRLVTNTTPLGRQTAMTYDPRGLVRTEREPSGQMTTNWYDARGRLTNRVDGAGSIAYTYDAGDLLLTVKEGTRTLTRTYDSLGRLETYTDGNTNQLRYNYDASGNLTRLQYPDGKAVNYSYDGRNQLTNVTDWAGRKTTLLYDLNGRVTQIIRPNLTKRLVNYDEAGQTTRIEERDGQNYLIALFRYRYDAAGQITNRFAVPVRPDPVLPQDISTYDADNRMATISLGDEGNNPITITHDADGNLTSGPVTNAAASTYTWDARNRLKSAGSLSYAYDAEGNRIASTNGGQVTKFVVNPAPTLSQVLVRTKPDGSQTFYVYGLGLLYETATNGTTRTYHYDYLGNTVAISDDSGQVTDRVDYGPYALITWRLGNTDTPFLFNGRYGVMTDSNGLLNMRARYYNPYLCRFVSEDPAGFAGGMNFYAYADGNPVSFLDPFGFGRVGESQARSYLSASGLGVPGGGYMDPFGNVHATFCLSCHDNTPQAQFHKQQAVLANMLDWRVLAYQEALGAVLGLGAGAIAEDLAMARDLNALRQTASLENAAGTTPLYRAVMNGELADINSSGVFRNPAGIENKYFSTTAEGASSYAKQAYGKFGDTSPYTIIKTDAPSSLIPEIIPVDGGIPSVTIPTRSLPQLGKPQVLPYAPIPR